MPNWCENSLTVRGPKKALDAFKETLNTAGEDGEKTVFSFHQTVPQPKDILKGNVTMEAMAEAQEKGVDNWYNWNITNWGTKWDACEADVDVEAKKVNIHFQTAWSPPKEWMVAASKKFPELTFELACCECGGNYFGTISVLNGVLDEDINEIPDNATNDEGEPKGVLKRFLNKHGIGMGG
jgi:hypothetical protein